MNAYELADDVIHMLESWSKAYPTSMFPDPTQEDIDYINAQNKNLSARFFAHVGRHFINKGFTPAINMLRQQADRIAELENECAWAKDQWNKDRICFESRRNELEKDLALKTRDRDVFRDFTLAYEKRIEELEKVIQDGIKAFGEIQNQRLKDKFEKPQKKPLSNDEIREIGDECQLKNNGILNWIAFARAIEERQGLND